MKFHNQRSFMGHEISNVNNKPLLRKKGKQWIVVAISALVLAGFGGMVSTTTHADTTAQSTTTKVAPKLANTSANVMKQAQGMHKALANNVAVQKPSAPSSAVAKKTTLTSATSTTSVKSSSVSASSSASSKVANQSHNNLTSIRLTSSTPTSGTAGSDNKATWNVSDNTNLYIHGNGVNWYWPNLRPYKNVYISDVHFHGPGHMFSGLTNLNSITFGNNITNDAQYMDNDFNGDTNLQTIKGLNNFMDNDTNLRDYDYMFNNCINLKALDLSNFNTTQVATSGQITYTSDGYKGDGNYQAFHNTPSLSHVILGKNSILHSDSGISPYAIPQGTIGTSFEKLDDNQSHANPDGTPRTWNLCKTGNWIGNSGNWYLNNDNGALLITGNLRNSSNNSDDDGNSYQNLLKETGMSDATANTVKSISFSNATAPKDSWRLFDDENTGAFKNLQSIDLRGLHTDATTNFLAMFCGLSGLQHIYHLSDLDMHQASDEQWMFGFDPKLQGLDLSQIQNPKFDNANYLFENDNDLHQLTLGPGENLSSITDPPFNNWHNDNTNGTTNMTSLGQGTWNPIIKNSIHFNGAPSSDDKTVSDVDGTLSNVGAPSNYHYINGNNGSFTYSISDSNHLFDVAPNSINIIFKYKESSNHSDTSTNINTIGCTTNNYNLQNNIPKGYQLADPSEKLLYFEDNTTSYTVDLVPTQKTDIINYQYNGKSEGSTTFTGDDYAANGATNTSFTLSSGNASSMPANYHLVNERQSFDYDGGTYNVAVEPNEVRDNITFNSNNSAVSSTSMIGAYGTNNSVSAPNGYHFTNGSSTESFTYNTSTSFNVAPDLATEKINYIYHKGNGTFSEGSTSMSGIYDKSGNITSANDKSLNSGYQLLNANNGFTYANGSASDNVDVVPESANTTVDYQYNSSVVSRYTSSGNNYYATDAGDTVFNADDDIPAGYHAVDSNNSFYYDDQQHDVNVAPIEDTDTVDYQVNGSTLASQQFTGNDERATQAGNNSFDVTAKNDSNIPNGYELVNSDNNFGFDNGTHDVAIQPIPQPAPYIPSMPTSVASSASPVAATPASVSSTISKLSSEAKPTHYRYAKVVTPLQLHTSKHFTSKNGVLTIKHPTEFKIMKVVHDHKLTRYEVRYNHKNYFITANDHFTINNYVQKHDFKSHKHMMVKVITPMIEYKHAHFSKKNAIKVFKKGAVLPIKRVFTIGKGEMTRFELTNGRYVTSNKLFVKVIK